MSGFSHFCLWEQKCNYRYGKADAPGRGRGTRQMHERFLRELGRASHLHTQKRSIRANRNRNAQAISGQYCHPIRRKKEKGKTVDGIQYRGKPKVRRRVKAVLASP